MFCLSAVLSVLSMKRRYRMNPDLIQMESSIRFKQLPYEKTFFSMGISVTAERMMRFPHTQKENFVVSWMLSGKGTFTDNNQVYPLYGGTVCIRRPDHAYCLDLSAERSVRLYIDVPEEMYHAMKLFVPELASVSPVRSMEFRQDLYQDFLNLYDVYTKTSPDELYTVFGPITHLICCLTGILSDREQHPLHRAQRMLDDVSSARTLEEIAASCGMNYHSFRRSFTAEFGISPGKYRNERRIEAACRLLMRGEPIKEIALQVGYSDAYTFTHRFTAETGISPSRYREEKLCQK